jgi:mycofactocin precursor
MLSSRQYRGYCLHHPRVRAQLDGSECRLRCPCSGTASPVLWHSVPQLLAEVIVTDKATEAAGQVLATEDLLAEEELLVEEVSIDGMCGVY